MQLIIWNELRRETKRLFISKVKRRRMFCVRNFCSWYNQVRIAHSSFSRLFMQCFISDLTKTAPWAMLPIARYQLHFQAPCRSRVALLFQQRTLLTVYLRYEWRVRCRGHRCIQCIWCSSVALFQLNCKNDLTYVLIKFIITNFF